MPLGSVVRDLPYDITGVNQDDLCRFTAEALGPSSSLSRDVDQHCGVAAEGARVLGYMLLLS